MNLTLNRLDYLSTGIFGQIEDEEGTLLLQTCEHAYPYTPDGAVSSVMYGPKVPAGSYKCVRGMHQLEGMSAPFECFQLQNVPGHTNILIHIGNKDSDSSGCILVGLTREGDEILQSRIAFNRLMDALTGMNEFTLVIQ